MDRQKFEEFISQYPIYEYRLLDTQNIRIEERVRTICSRSVPVMALPGPVPQLWALWRSVRKESKNTPRLYFFPVWQRCQIS